MPCLSWHGSDGGRTVRSWHGVNNQEGGRNERWRSAHAPFLLSLGPQPDTAALQVCLPISLNLREIIPHRYEQNYLPLVNPSCWQPRFTITFRRRPEQHHLQKSQEGTCKETKKLETFQKRCKEKRQTPTPAGGMERRFPEVCLRKPEEAGLNQFLLLRSNQSACGERASGVPRQGSSIAWASYSSTVPYWDNSESKLQQAHFCFLL